MREYGQVQCTFWTSTDAKAMSADARMLAVYLLTCPHSNGLGCYALPDGYVMADLKWSQETISKGFAELSQVGFAKRCESTDFVLIPNFLRWNPISNPNVAAARVKEFEAVSRKSAIYKELCEAMLLHGKHWKPEFETLLKGFGKPLPKQDPTLTEPKEEGVNAPLPINGHSASRRFVPPTVEQVREYVIERGSHVDPEQFCDFYASKGWKIGKDKMSDWKAAVRTWEKRHKDEAPQREQPAWR